MSQGGENKPSRKRTIGEDFVPSLRVTSAGAQMAPIAVVLLDRAFASRRPTALSLKVQAVVLTLAIVAGSADEIQIDYSYVARIIGCRPGAVRTALTELAETAVHYAVSGLDAKIAPFDAKAIVLSEMDSMKAVVGFPASVAQHVVSPQRYVHVDISAIIACKTTAQIRMREIAAVLHPIAALTTVKGSLYRWPVAPETLAQLLGYATIGGERVSGIRPERMLQECVYPAMAGLDGIDVGQVIRRNGRGRGGQVVEAIEITARDIGQDIEAYRLPNLTGKQLAVYHLIDAPEFQVEVGEIVRAVHLMRLGTKSIRGSAGWEAAKREINRVHTTWLAHLHQALDGRDDELLALLAQHGASRAFRLRMMDIMQDGDRWSQADETWHGSVWWQGRRAWYERTGQRLPDAYLDPGELRARYSAA